MRNFLLNNKILYNKYYNDKKNYINTNIKMNIKVKNKDI